MPEQLQAFTAQLLLIFDPAALSLAALSFSWFGIPVFGTRAAFGAAV